MQLTVAALRGMFRVHEIPGVCLNSYADVFGRQGMLMHWAMSPTCTSSARRKALMYLRTSLQLREGKGQDAGHQFITEAIRACVESIQSLDA